jgi:hypothetical protein
LYQHIVSAASKDGAAFVDALRTKSSVGPLLEQVPTISPTAMLWTTGSTGASYPFPVITGQSGSDPSTTAQTWNALEIPLTASTAAGCAAGTPAAAVPVSILVATSDSPNLSLTSAGELARSHQEPVLTEIQQIEKMIDEKYAEAGEVGTKVATALKDAVKDELLCTWKRLASVRANPKMKNAYAALEKAVKGGSTKDTVMSIFDEVLDAAVQLGERLANNNNNNNNNNNSSSSSNVEAQAGDCSKYTAKEHAQWLKEHIPVSVDKLSKKLMKEMQSNPNKAIKVLSAAEVVEKTKLLIDACLEPTDPPQLREEVAFHYDANDARYHWCCMLCKEQLLFNLDSNRPHEVNTLKHLISHINPNKKRSAEINDNSEPMSRQHSNASANSSQNSGQPGASGRPERV